jgi:hypothetical protein
MPLVARVWLLGLTGTYAAIGAARIVEDGRGEQEIAEGDRSLLT